MRRIIIQSSSSLVQLTSPLPRSYFFVGPQVRLPWEIQWLEDVENSYNSQLSPTTVSSQGERISYMELKNSINSSIPIQDKDLELVSAVLTSRTGKAIARPVPPKRPGKFGVRMAKPKLILLNESNLPYLSNLPDSDVVRRRIFARRYALLVRLNKRRVARYTEQLRRYERLVAHAAEINSARQASYEKALKSYQERLSKYEQSLKKQQLRLLLKVHRPWFSEPHPFSLMQMRPRDGVGSYSLQWDSQRPSTVTSDTSWAACINSQSAVFTKSTLTTIRDDYVQSLYDEISLLAEEAVINIEPKAIRKLYAKLSDGKVHIGNMLAERVQTIDLIKTNFVRLTRAILSPKSVIKGLISIIRDPKLIANEFLAFKFGVEPLVSDLDGALKALASLPNPDSTITVKSRNRRIISVDTPYGSFSGIVTLNYTARFRITNDIAHNLQELGLLQPAPILWEVTPFSFVIDWLIPIGDFLTGLTADIGLSEPVITRSISLTGTFKLGSSYPEEAFSGTRIRRDGVLTLDGHWKSRKLLDSLPDLTKILSVKSPFTWIHSLESIALLVQRLKKL